ncbi:MAG: DNA primase [Gammaproteobacteria bacterium]
MAGLIPQQFIDDLLARTDIVDVIDGYVPLKRAGKNHQACCPFHDEKTPSFTVSQQKQFYHCFGCGANGSAIGFLMEYMNMGFVEAVEELASRAGMEIPKEAINSRVNPDTSELYELMELVNKFYLKQLRQHPEASRVIDYLKGRGISGEIAARYELGFAPPGWDNLIAELGRSDAGIKRLQKTGAIIEKDNGGFYDRFRHRLMFPIRDQRGRVIGFGGRVLEADAKPKYLNSPETPIFQKGHELYGLYQARKELKDTDCVYVVEGYMDVIALAQHGINNAVASLGTAATTEHIDKLFRHSGKLVFCFDGDEAGKKAAWRALENTLPILKDDKQAYFIFLPSGEDPDSYVRTHGREAFLDKSLQLALSEFLFKSLSEKMDLNSAEGKAGLAKSALPLIAQLKLNAPALCSILLKNLNNLTDIPVTELNIQLDEYKRTGKIPNMPKARKLRPESSPRQQSLLAESIKCLLRRPQLALDHSINDTLAHIEIRGIEFLREIVSYVNQNPRATYANIIENYRDREKIHKRLVELAPSDSKYEADDDSAFTDDAIHDRFFGALKKLVELTERRHFDELTDMKSTSELSEEQKLRLRSMQRSDVETDSKS